VKLTEIVQLAPAAKLPPCAGQLTRDIAYLLLLVEMFSAPEALPLLAIVTTWVTTTPSLIDPKNQLVGEIVSTGDV